jgi:hypothetical protein
VTRNGYPARTIRNFFHVQPFLRDGDNPEHNTKGKEELRGHVYLSIKSKAKVVRNPHDPTKWIAQGGQPGIIGPNKEDLLPVDLYSGCFARASGIIFGTEYSGKRYISVRLNNVQKAWDGERLGGGGGPTPRASSTLASHRHRALRRLRLQHRHL